MEQNATILVVDDEADLRDIIQGCLQDVGYTVLTATDGTEAVQLLPTRTVDLILTDIEMPDMNGYQLYQAVQQRPEWRVIPFIFLSARTLDSDIRFGKSLGVDDYLTKPIRPADLLAVVQGKLRRSEQLREMVTEAASTSAAPIGAGALQIDRAQHKVWLADREIKLSAREFALLAHLAEQAGKVVSPQDLVRVTHQLETDHVEAASLLGPLIHAVRRKLGAAVGETGLIENVRGVGYRLLM